MTLEIYPHFALDGNAGRYTFFGFTNAVEREFFEALLSVASIGPKSAARAFSAPMGRIARAIDEGDHAFLKSLPGIGQQKARDIVAKLQGKVTRFLLIQDAPQRVAPDTPPMPDFASEALAVLLQLAYKRPEAEAMIAQTLERAPQRARRGDPARRDLPPAQHRRRRGMSDRCAKKSSDRATAGDEVEPRIVEADASLEDEVYGATLRPRSFEDYVGQEQIVDNLRIAIDAAARRGEPLEHVLSRARPASARRRSRT